MLPPNINVDARLNRHSKLFKFMEFLQYEKKNANVFFLYIYFVSFFVYCYKQDGIVIFELRRFYNNHFDWSV